MAGWEALQQGAPDPFFPSGRPPEIGSEAWVKAQIAAKLSPEERDRPKS